MTDFLKSDSCGGGRWARGSSLRARPAAVNAFAADRRRVVPTASNGVWQHNHVHLNQRSASTKEMNPIASR